MIDLLLLLFAVCRFGDACCCVFLDWCWSGSSSCFFQRNAVLVRFAFLILIFVHFVRASTAVCRVFSATSKQRYYTTGT